MAAPAIADAAARTTPVVIIPTAVESPELVLCDSELGCSVGDGDAERDGAGITVGEGVAAIDVTGRPDPIIGRECCAPLVGSLGSATKGGVNRRCTDVLAVVVTACSIELARRSSCFGV